jgi:hypothetical protein
MANKFVSFLDKLGADFKLGVTKALALEKAAIPAEQAVISAISIVSPAIGTTLSDILQPIIQTEQVATAVGANSGTGAQKLSAALPALEAAISADPIFKGKTIANLPQWNAAIEAITSSFADLLDSVQSPTTTTSSSTASASSTATAASANMQSPVVQVPSSLVK